jgi:hypothetical protein
LNHFAIALQAECTLASCPQMKAEAWEFLCAAHASPQAVISTIAHALYLMAAVLRNRLYDSYA